MKFSTMLLPTGEFIFLIGEASDTEPGLAQAMTHLRDLTGAVAVFAGPGPLTGTDALYDENARRRDPDPIETLLESGADFTPAGLVDHRSLSEIVEQDVLGQDARTRQRGLVAGVQRSPEYHFPDPPTGHAEIDDETPSKPVGVDTNKPKPIYSPNVGDRVRLHGRSEMGFDCDGEEATVNKRLRNGYWEVRRDNDDYNNYLPIQLELIQPDPVVEPEPAYEPKVGDRVTVTGFSFMGSDRIGYFGEVTDLDGPYSPDAPIVVRFEVPRTPGGAMTANYKPTDLEPAPAKPYVPQTGDRVRLIGKSHAGFDLAGCEAVVDTDQEDGFWAVEVDGVFYEYATDQMELISRG